MHGSSRDKDKRQQKQVSTSWLAILDIEHFKNINDQYGHICGDGVLLVLAQKMRHFFRSTDLIFRFGGEEFVIVFEPTDADSISNKMAEFIQLIRDTSFPFVENMTFSAGLARISPYDFPIAVLESADKALYYAKNNGRDKFCIYEDLLAAYSGDGEHRFRFYREHLNSTHWVHDIFNLSVHDGQF